jgi:hypothetical protein
MGDQIPYVIHNTPLVGSLALVDVRELVECL